MARVFPHLFLTGLGIPKRLTPCYWRHLCKHYDGRFESDPEFLTTVFSLMMMQSTSIQGYRPKKSNPESLELMGEMINSGHLREIVETANTSEEKRKEVDGILSQLF